MIKKEIDKMNDEEIKKLTVECNKDIKKMVEIVLRSYIEDVENTKDKIEIIEGSIKSEPLTNLLNIVVKEIKKDITKDKEYCTKCHNYYDKEDFDYKYKQDIGIEYLYIDPLGHDHDVAKYANLNLYAVCPSCGFENKIKNIEKKRIY